MIDRPPASPVAEPILPLRDERKAAEELISFEGWMALGIAPRLPALPDESPSSAHPIPSQARIFNERGFFGETQTLQTGEPASLEHSAPCLAEGMPPEPMASASGADNILSPASGSGNGARTLAKFDAPATAPRSAPGNAAPRQLSGAFPIEHPVEPLPLADAQSAPEGLSSQNLRTARAQSLLSIAVRDIERGLQVRVTAQALSRDERERLASEIAALLSRHGFTSQEVLIVAPTPNRDAGKKQDAG